MKSANEIRFYRLIIIPLFLTLAIFSVYGPVLNNDFCIVDDNVYVTESSLVQKGLSREAITRAFTGMHANFYHPLTTLSHMLDFELYGLNPFGHHLTALLLHTLNSIILFLFFNTLTGKAWPSFMLSALFALHPMHVESVAWISARKDLLSTFFGILAMFAYVRYAKNRSFQNLFLTVFIFLLSLLAKPMLVTLPFVFLLLDYWPLERMNPIEKNREGTPFLLLIREKIPFFFLAIVFSALAFLAQKKGGALSATVQLPIELRVENALFSYFQYFLKTFYPLNLALFYPHPGDSLSNFKVVSATIFLIAVSILSLTFFKDKRYFFFGWFWFLGTLVPVIGLVQVGSFAMADRYTYVPLIGIFIIFVWGAHDFLSQSINRAKALKLASSLVLLFLMITTWIQVQYWDSDETLLKQAIAVTENNIFAHQNLGTTFFKQNRHEEAIKQYLEALKIKPEFEPALIGLGTSYAIINDTNKSIFYLERAVTINDSSAPTHANLATQLTKVGRYPEAANHYFAALSIDPGRISLHFRLAEVLNFSGRKEEAVSHYKKVILIVPDHIEALNNLGVLYYETKRPRQAIEQFKVVLKLDPDFPNAHYNLGVAYGEIGENEKAFEEIKKAMQSSSSFNNKL